MKSTSEFKILFSHWLCDIEPENHPIVIHCSHGKDRTGLSAAIIQAAVGVAREEIILDYSLSDEYGSSAEGRRRFEVRKN